MLDEEIEEWYKDYSGFSKFRFPKETQGELLVIMFKVMPLYLEAGTVQV
jgi:hypothetical protein